MTVTRIDHTLLNATTSAGDVDALIERAAADPELHQLTLNVTAGNAVAERLYERSGFVRYGTLPRAIRVGGVFHDKHHMLLSLK